jgi:predicted transposase/invertase (TIGR01784 family)
MPYDNLCKYLAEQYPHHFASWLLGEPLSDPEQIEVLKTELSNEPVRADAVLLLKEQHTILQIEFQTTPFSRPPLPLRMLDYWVRLHRQHNLPVDQYIILLEETEVTVSTEFRAANTWHRYNVIKLWEQEPQAAEKYLGLLPLVTLMHAAQPEQMLTQVANRLLEVEPTALRSELVVCANVLAGLRYDKLLLNRLFPEEIMRESVTYQEIVQRGLQQGLQQGLLQGKVETLLQMLRHQYGELSAATETRISALPAEALDKLIISVLDFHELQDLETWLENHSYKM